MAGVIRRAAHSDVASISEWTRDTFAWGDYIPERLPLWIDDPDSEALVVADEHDVPIAVAHVAMLSTNEAWIEGARVHPDHRRKGLGSDLNHAGVAWAAEQGARVMRLATETDNEPARRQVEGLGYREVSRWVYAVYRVDGSHRAPEKHRLRPAPSSDAEAAWLFWAASDLARDGRELIPLGWQWRKATPADVTTSVTGGRLFQSPAGWIIVDHPAADWISSNWVATTPDDILSLLDGLLDLAAERQTKELTLKLPDVAWATEAVRRTGGEIGETLIFAKAI